jgi:hypothetical protein
MNTRRKPNLMLIIGGIILLIVAVGFVQLVLSVRNETGVMVANRDVAAFSTIGKDDLVEVKVPKASVTDSDLTADEYEQLKDKGIVATVRFLKGSRINEAGIAKNPQGSFMIVSSDERVIGVTASLSGVSGGTVQVGDVVDVRAAGVGADSSAAYYAKVLCIADKPNGCDGVLPPGIELSGDKDKKSPGDQSLPVMMLLAVAKDDALGLSGANVSVALNPFCRTDENGKFVSAREDKPCVVGEEAAMREAAQADEQAAASGENQESDGEPVK